MDDKKTKYRKEYYLKKLFFCLYYKNVCKYNEIYKEREEDDGGIL